MPSMNRPHESPHCTCEGCKDYDDDVLEALKAIHMKGSLSIDFILSLFDVDPTLEELRRELARPSPSVPSTVIDSSEPDP